MARSYYWEDISVLPDDLRAFAWSAPMRDLAAKLDISDVGLKKRLASYGVAPPPQGYWNKVAAKKPVPACPKAPQRRPGETGRVRVDRCFAAVVPQAAPMPSGGPFSSKFIPEDIEELRANELAALGRVRVPNTLDGGHAGLFEIRKREEKRQAKHAQTGYLYDSPYFDNPLDKRRLRLLNALYLALSKRGHGGSAYERDGIIHAVASVGDMGIGVEISVAGRHRTEVRRGYHRPAADLPATTPLQLQINPGFDNKALEVWRDDDDGKLEAKVAAIAADVVVAGEVLFRRSLREAEEAVEARRAADEKRRRAELAELNRRRLDDLNLSGELLRKAQDLRALVARVREEMETGAGADPHRIIAWERWALAEADRLDPVLSGQILSHLDEPKLP
jgi:hypothetical protein